MDYGLDGPGVILGGARFFSFPRRPDRLLKQRVPGVLSPGSKEAGA
jgi:hypothetical protein